MKNPNKKSRGASKSLGNQAVSEPLSDLVGAVVYAYTRAQAIADGVQVDASAMASEVGIYCPVYITSTIYATCVVDGGKALGLSDQDSLKRFLQNVRRVIIQKNKPRITFSYVVLYGEHVRREEVIIARCTQDVTNWIPALTVMAQVDE